MNLIDKINELINENVITKLSSITGDSPKSIEKGLQSAIPTILLALVNKDQTELSSVLEIAKNNFSGTTTSQNHSNILKSIFGDKLENILFSIADYAGIKQSTMHLVANTSIASIFDSIKKFVPSFDFQGVKNLLSDNENTIVGLIPSQFNSPEFKPKATFDTVKPQEPINTATPVEEKVEEKIVERIVDRHKEPVKPLFNDSKKENKQLENTKAVTKKSGPLKWIILLLALLAIAFFVWKSCNKPKADTLNKVDTTSVVIDEVPAIIIKDSLLVNLPNGTTINAFKGGIEEQLVEFLKTDYKALGEKKLKETWFDFDNLNFETGSANVTEESKLQLDNIVAILKSFPNVKIKLGGYTDKTGDESINKKISLERANAVKSHIDAAGLGKQVISAEGYGSEFAKFESDAPETDRILDRHVSLSVR